MQDEGDIQEDLEMQQPPYVEEGPHIKKDLVIPIPTYTGSGREVRKPVRLIETIGITSNYKPTKIIKLDKLNNQFIQSLHWKKLTDAVHLVDLQAFLSFINYSTNIDNNTIEELHPFPLATQANAADNPTWEEAINGPNSDGYWKAMEMRSRLSSKM